MAEDPRTILHFKTLAKFNERLADGTINPNKHFCIIHDAKMFWVRGTLISDNGKLDLIEEIFNNWKIVQEDTDKITISLEGKKWKLSTTEDNVNLGEWEDVSYPLEIQCATLEIAGLMSAEDKVNLDVTLPEAISDNKEEIKKILQLIVDGKETAEEAIEELSKLGESYQSVFDIANTLKTFLEDSDTQDTTINRWKELEKFLQGITDSNTLSGLLEELKNIIKSDVTHTLTIKQNGSSVGTYTGLSDKSINIVDPTDISGNAGTATLLKTTRTLWGRNFNGTQNVNGAITDVGNIYPNSSGRYVGYTQNTSDTYHPFYRLCLGTNDINTSPSPGITIGDNASSESEIRRILLLIQNNTSDIGLYLTGNSTDNVGIGLTAGGDTDRIALTCKKINENIGGVTKDRPALALAEYAEYFIPWHRNAGGVSLGSEDHRWWKGHIEFVYGTVMGSSDIKLKDNIEPIKNLTVDKIAEAPAITFNWKKDGKEDFGTTAQYWKDVFPLAVEESSDSLYLKYANLGVVNSIIIAKEFKEYKEKTDATILSLIDKIESLEAKLNKE